nr:hypothetical protein [Tanacetum cinerariifolium]
MEDINNFQQEPNETLYQVWKRFKKLLMKCPQHYLTEMWEVILFYNRLDVQTRQILDSKGAIPSKTVVDAKVAIQEMAEYSQKWHNGTSRTRSPTTPNITHSKKKVKPSRKPTTLNLVDLTKEGYRAAAPGFYQRNNANPSYQERRQSMKETLRKFMCELEKRHEENSNMIKKIRALTDAAVRNQGASIKTLEIQIAGGKYGRATKIKTWEILLLENRSAKLHVWKQKVFIFKRTLRGRSLCFVLEMRNNVTPPDTYSVQAPSGGVTHRVKLFKSMVFLQRITTDNSSVVLGVVMCVLYESGRGDGRIRRNTCICEGDTCDCD